MNEYRQLPRGDQIFLDHHGHFVPDMDAASEALEQLGFQLTPYTAHTMRTSPNEEPKPSGTGNRCIMLRESYIEVLCAVGEAPMARQLREAVNRYTGIHLMAFTAIDAESHHTRLNAAGFDMQPLVHLTRQVEGGTLRFSVVRMIHGQMAEGRIQFLTHNTPDLLWRKELMDHPNKVVSMTDVAMASADPQEAAQRFERYLGLAPVPSGSGWHFSLGRGSLTILSADAFQAVLPGVDIPDMPFIGAYSLRSENLSATKAVLNGNGIQTQEIASDTLRVDPLPALGSTMIFTQGAAKAPWMED
tara:strand:+ start:810 stop:1715 length:906 start_codon:yes stop_codon:yes gene_type:complete